MTVYAMDTGAPAVYDIDMTNHSNSHRPHVSACPVAAGHTLCACPPGFGIAPELERCAWCDAPPVVDGACDRHAFPHQRPPVFDTDPTPPTGIIRPLFDAMLTRTRNVATSSQGGHRR